MKQNLLFYGLALASAYTTAQAAEKNHDSNLRKNVLFIAVDDLKPLLGCYGDGIAKTPQMDRLAARGTLFSNAYCQQAVSGPSRASLLTGMCPDHTKVWDLKTLIRSKNPEVITLPQHFKENGYVVAGIGKIYDPRSVDKQQDERSWLYPYMDQQAYLNPQYGKPVMGHYQKEETKRLYEKYKAEAEAKGLKRNKIESYVQERLKPSTECVNVPDDAYFDGGTLKGAVEFLKNYREDKPFFLAVGFKKPHLPFCAPEKYWKLYDREKMPLAEFKKKAEGSPDFAYHNSGELQSYSDIPPLASFSDIENLQLPDYKAQELIHGYYACVSYVDALVGELVETLRKKGLDKNTVIVLWGDHGWHLGDHGLWNKHSNFEQATHVPMLIIDPSATPQKVNLPVGFIDIYPTLCDLTGLRKPAQLEGQSLAGLITKEKNRDAIKPYAVSQYPRMKKMGYSIRDKRYRYTVWVKWENDATDINTIYAEELYDYEKDPNETVNRVNSEEYKAVLKQMKDYWKTYCKENI